MRCGSYHVISGLVFIAIAVVQLVRAALQIQVQIGQSTVPLWPSWVAVVLASGLAYFAFSSRSKSLTA